ncbi:GNAT family N-acetyltransferase [Nostocoides sp. HKS02]|uniref:GNAT family N-acetyltransferase n=1 Tax=Nostocoides sp. HKS02 TaxID=1813880 RepID=UPI001E5A2B32|nr:GNAT family N-acetyltransferase [Tetrasphaera sp. HKS02]
MRAVVEITWGPWSDSQQRAFHAEWFDPQRLSIIVAGGQDIGVLDAEVRADGTAYLARVEILPEYQGRGIGGRVIQQFVEHARTQAARTVELDVLLANVDAQRLYERLGFEHVADSRLRRRMRLQSSE